MSASLAPRPWRNAIEHAISAYGTPCYITRAQPIQEAVAELEDGHHGRVRQWLSVKTHPLASLIQWWARSGRGVEVVSEVELAGALALGCPASSLLVNGVAKHEWLPRYPVRNLRVHFDSIREIDSLLPMALDLEWRVGVRLHAPGERDAKDARFGGPFGMSADEGVISLRRLIDCGAAVESVHFHLGQRPMDADAYVRAIDYVIDVCGRSSFRPRFVDCGGGLPSRGTASHAFADLGRAVDVAFTALAPELEQVWLEHGRYLLEPATVLALRVIDIKDRPECRYLICDGGRTNHALAADKGPHAMWLLREGSETQALTTICGPTCMTDDILGRMPLPADITVGDVLVWSDAGAYHLPWETRFSHGLCAVVWCDENETPSLARRRERPEHWITSCH